MVTFNIKLAGIVICINAFYESTKKYCKDFFTNEKEEYVITLTMEDLKNEINYSSTGQVYVNEEISATYRKIADILIERNIIVFHSSSFMVDNKGYLLTARSGVGKSTHTKLLKELLGDKLIYINDDKPLIEVGNNIFIHSSPWNGKERRGNNISSSLDAIIFLNRGDNTYKKISDKKEIYFKMLSQIYLPLDKTKREKALLLADKIFMNTDFYEINVNKDISSAVMTYERIIKDETK